MKKKTIIFTSTATRHFFFIEQLSLHFNIKAIVLQEKKNYYLKQKESKKVKDHFTKFNKRENDFFKISPKEILKNNKIFYSNDINDDNIFDLIKKIKVDFICVFGTSIIRKRLLDHFNLFINLHLGLSPFYKGSGTLFWPIHNNEFSCIGTTCHILDEKIDNGPIISRTKPDLRQGDDYYAINLKAIHNGIKDFPISVINFLNNNITPQKQDIKIRSRIYKKADFNEDALLKAMDNIRGGLTIQQIKTEKCDF